MKMRRRLEGIGRRRPGDDEVVPSSHRKPSVFFLPPLSRLAAAMERGHTLATNGWLQHRIELVRRFIIRPSVITTDGARGSIQLYFPQPLIPPHRNCQNGMRNIAISLDLSP
ncbi:hypothetical protein ACQJBY_059909 [Aegilops geniculata]